MSKLYVIASPGTKLPIPRSLGLRLAGYFPEDEPVRVPNDPYIRRRIAEGSLLLSEKPSKAKPPAASKASEPKASTPSTSKPRS